MAAFAAWIPDDLTKAMQPTTRVAPSTQSRIITWVCAFSPLIALLLLLTVSLHVRYHYGGWPDHAIDNFPAGLLGIHYLFFLGSMIFAAVGAIPVWILCVCIRPLRLTVAEHFLQTLIFILAWGLHILVISGAGKSLTWLLD